MKTRSVTICTVVTANYAHFALALGRSIRRHQPDANFVVCIVDRNKDLETMTDRNTSFIYADELGLEDFQRFCFQYNAFELSCALKPKILEVCLERFDSETVIYLDADMQLFRNLNELLAIDKPFSVALTPHLVSPLPDDERLPNHRSFLLSGAYNAGFICVNRCQDGFAFLHWWQNLMEHECIVQMSDGYFVDQRPLDLVPGLFESVHIHRRPGFHLAYWNMHDAQVFERPGGYYLQKNEPVVIFHYSGLTLDQPRNLSRYQNRLRLDKYPVVAQMIDQYITELTGCGRDRFEKLTYRYDYLESGARIKKTWREAVRQGDQTLGHVGDPFQADWRRLEKLIGESRFQSFIVRCREKLLKVTGRGSVSNGSL